MNVTEHRRALLSEYTPWMFRDYVMNQGLSTAIVVSLIGVIMLLPLTQATATQLGHVPVDVARGVLREMAVPLVFLGTLFATNGIVATDRKLGYYRFLFSKPVRPPLYYGLTFGVYGVGLIVVTLVLMALWAVVIRPMFPPQLPAVVVIMYLAYGGLGFLLSAAWRFDWLSLVSVLLVANIAWTLWAKSTSALHVLLYLLPPVHRANDIYALLTQPSYVQPPWISIAWLAGYGLACFVLGLAVIRRRPLGTS